MTGTGTHDEMFLIQGRDGAARANLVVHERLGERRLVEFIVTPGENGPLSSRGKGKGCDKK